MAHPKRRQSHTRTAKRRTHDKALIPTLAICPQLWRLAHLSHSMRRVWLLPRQTRDREGSHLNPDYAQSKDKRHSFIRA